jgi:hypothetical protein
MKTMNRRTKLAAAAISALLVTALLATGALAVTSPDQTRETYATQVEPICQANTKSNEQILSGVRKKIQKGQLSVAAGQFTRAATAFGKAVTQIKAVPQPSADVAKLSKWTKALEGETKLLSEIGKALKGGNKSKAQSLSVQLTRNGNTANNAVLGFDFNYCLIDSSRFS